MAALSIFDLMGSCQGLHQQVNGLTQFSTSILGTSMQWQESPRYQAMETRKDILNVYF
jgi:hypothetical protein